MRLKRSEDVPMSQLSRIKSTEEDHDQSNVVCEELKDKLKVTAHPVVTIGKVLQKKGIREMRFLYLTDMDGTTYFGAACELHAAGRHITKHFVLV